MWRRCVEAWWRFWLRVLPLPPAVARALLEGLRMSEPVRETVFNNLGATLVPVTPGETAVTRVFGTNNSGAAAFIQIFNLAPAQITLGTTVPRFTWPIPPSSGLLDINFGERPCRFDTQMVIASTTTPTGNVGSAAGVSVQVVIN